MADHRQHLAAARPAIDYRSGEQSGGGLRLDCGAAAAGRILIALTVSGVMFVTAQENDERLTKARGMLYYTLIGFAFIAFSFAIVKALTDIDFFRFI